jgi:hypothetical protein
MEAAWWQLSMSGNLVGRVASVASSPPPPPTLSSDPKLWQQRVNGWEDTLAGLESSVVSPSPFLYSVYAWPRLGKLGGSWPQATSMLKISDKFLHDEGHSLAGLGASVVPSSPSCEASWLIREA